MTSSVLLALLPFSVAAVLIAAFVNAGRSSHRRRPPSWNDPDQGRDD